MSHLSKLCIPALIALAGCNDGGGDDDGGSTDDPATELEGLYKVDYEGRSQDCGDLEDYLGDPYFRLVHNSGVLEYYTCRSPSDCDELPADDRLFEEDEDDGIFKAITTWTFWNGDDPAGGVCAMNARKRELRRPSEAGLNIITVQILEAFQSPSFTGEDVCEGELTNWVPRFAGAETLNCERVESKVQDEGGDGE